MSCTQASNIELELDLTSHRRLGIHPRPLLLLLALLLSQTLLLVAEVLSLALRLW